MNTYLREFVQISIDDWVEFIKYFTMPDLNNDQLWKVNETPFLVIHLSVRKKDKKKKGADKKKTDKKNDSKAPEAAEEEEEEDDSNKVVYKPSIQQCQEFVTNSMNMIIKSTNKVYNLESNLMPFLKKQ
jgi:hypothetical protein